MSMEVEQEEQLRETYFGKVKEALAKNYLIPVLVDARKDGIRLLGLDTPDVKKQVASDLFFRFKNRGMIILEQDWEIKARTALEYHGIGVDEQYLAELSVSLQRRAGARLGDLPCCLLNFDLMFRGAECC